MGEVIGSEFGVVLVTANVFSEILFANLNGVIDGKCVSVIDIRETVFWLSICALCRDDGDKKGQKDSFVCKIYHRHH